MVTWRSREGHVIPTLCQRSRDPDIESFFASDQTTYSVHPTKLSLIPQYDDVRPTHGSTCSQGHGGGWEEKRLLSWRPQAYSELNDVTRMVMAWGCVQPPEGLGPTRKTSGHESRPAGRSKIGSLLVRRQLPICLLQ